MKLVVSLSTLALISIANVAPCLATNRPSSRSVNQSTSSQTGLTENNSFQVAGLLDDAFKVIKKVDRYNKQRKTTIENKKKDDDRRRRQEELALERQQRLAAYQKQREGRRAALQAKRQKEQDYVNSLSPEQKEKYLAQKRAQEAAMLEFWIKAFGMVAGGNSAAPESGNNLQDQIDRERREERFRQQPAPQPAPPVNNAISDWYETTKGVGN
jgi:hypothetical protein